MKIIKEPKKKGNYGINSENTLKELCNYSKMLRHTKNFFGHGKVGSKHKKQSYKDSSKAQG